MNKYSGSVRNEFKKRLASDWVDLSNILDIPDHVRNTWKSGLEAEGIWVFLDSRQQLNRLPQALDDIDRPDLANLFRSSDEQGDNDAVSSILKLLGIDPAKHLDSTQLHALTTLVQGKKKSDLDELARKVREQLSAVLSEPLGQDQSEAEVSQLYQELPKYSGLEAAIVGVACDDDCHDFSGQSFVKNYEEASRRICLIGNASRFVGTGFLVAENRVMTNYHVWEAAIKLPGELFAYFDHNGTSPLNMLPKHGINRQPRALSLIEKLDYAFLELIATVDTKRGYFSLSNHRAKDREAVHVIGFPGKKGKDGDVIPAPLTMRFGILFDSNSQTKRIAYSAETAPGSSGSPVFRENFELIGLHHHGETGFNNHGIPMWAIIDDLKGEAKQLVTIAKAIPKEKGEDAPESQDNGQGNSTSADEAQTDDFKYEERIAQLHVEIRKYIAEFSAEMLAKLAKAFEVKIDDKVVLPVAQQKLFDHVVHAQYKLPRALHRTRPVHSGCDVNNKRRIKELLIRVCPLRFNTKEIHAQIRKARRGVVGEMDNAEILMAGVDGAPARTKLDAHHPGLKTQKLAELGFSPGASQATISEDELKTFLADLHSVFCKRLSVSEIAEKSLVALADELNLQSTALSAQADDRTAYCVVILPKHEIHRQHALALVNRASELIQDIVWIEYRPEKMGMEREFSLAFAWILNLDD